MNKIVLLFLSVIISFEMSAQDIEVKKFEPLQNDQTAALSARKDINGNTCGLVKELLKEPDVGFKNRYLAKRMIPLFKNNHLLM